MKVTVPASINWNDVEVGQELPAEERDITATLIAVGAIATRDMVKVHHDAAVAKAANAQDIFMNILTTNGLIGKYLTAWSGPRGELKRIALRLGASNYPGDRMVTTGKVVKKYEEAGEHLVEVEYVGKNQLGNHVYGSAILALPAEGGKRC